MKFRVVHCYEDVDEKYIEEIESEHDEYDEAVNEAKRLNRFTSSYETYVVRTSDT